MILYVYGKCSTCRQALVFLKEHKITFTVKEITIEPPSIEELQLMLKFQNGNLKKIFNVSGQLYKEMQLRDKLEGMSIDQALALLSQQGMLVKRPFLLGKDFGFTGFNEISWAKKISF